MPVVGFHPVISYTAWSGGIGPSPGGLTNYCPSVLDTVGWVIWPVKIVSDMTYNVFGGTLNRTLLLYSYTAVGHTTTRHLDSICKLLNVFKC